MPRRSWLLDSGVSWARGDALGERARRARALGVAAFVVVAGAALLVACASNAPTKSKRTPVDPGDYGDDTPGQQDGLSPTRDVDSGAFGISARPAPDAGPLADGGPFVDAGRGDGGPAPKVYCVGALAAGDLAITELLVSSRTGSLDDGEWVEVRSTRTCWLELKGLTVESPRGATFDTTTVTEDFELEPKGTFLVADSADALKNHGLPGKIFAWDSSDVLKNDGDTVSLRAGGTVLDTLTYPAFSNLEPGRTLAFPDDCAPGVRADWARWSLTFNVWSPGFEGTPNATNDDVACY